MRALRLPQDAGPRTSLIDRLQLATNPPSTPLSDTQEGQCRQSDTLFRPNMSFLVDPSRPTNGQSGRSGGRSGKFTSKHGHRHHLYDSEKAPYPVSFDKHVLELSVYSNMYSTVGMSDHGFLERL